LKWVVHERPFSYTADEGDVDHQNGTWQMGPAIESAAGPIYGVRVTDGEKAEGSEYREVMAGLLDNLPGENVAHISPGDGWKEVVRPTDVDDLLSYEDDIPLTVVPGGFGSLLFCGLPFFLIREPPPPPEVADPPPDDWYPEIPTVSTDEFGVSTVQFPGMLVTYRQARHIWIGQPTLPPVVTTVVRQWPRDNTEGVSSAPRIWPPSRSNRLVGGYPGGSRA